MAVVLSLGMIAPLVGIGARALAVMNASTECLIGFTGVPAANANGGSLPCTDCDPTCDADGVSTPNRSCTFEFQVCVNQPGSTGTCTPASLKKVKVKGRCLTGSAPAPDGTSLACGAFTATVKTRKHGKRPGRCKVTATAIGSEKPKKADTDMLILECVPRQGACPPPTSTTTTTAATTTTTLSQSGCQAIVPAQPIPGKYRQTVVAGPKICTTGTGNQFHLCTQDSDCGSNCSPGCCAPTPWVTVGPGLQPLPTGITTDFDVATTAAASACEHAACIQCGNPNAVCTAIKAGCDAAANPRCVQDTCCDAPGFHLPALKINLGLFQICTRLDQSDCGLGVVNTSNPQSGHNEVKKSADSLDPGADCLYASSIDCTGSTVTNPGDTDDGACQADNAGKVRTCRGADVNPNPDADGIHVRLSTPGFATAWLIANDETCPPDAVFDGKHCKDTHTPCTMTSDCDATHQPCEPAESLFSSLYQIAEPTTAGATGEFTQLKPGDGCGLGPGSQGFTPSNPSGPIAIKGDAPMPHPYAGGDGRTVAAGAAFSPNSPLFDIGFVTVTQVHMDRLGAAEACTCVPSPICAER